MDHEQTVEAVTATIASKATYTGAATMGLGWLVSSEAAVLMGMIIGIAGFLVNWYFKTKQDRRAEREHAARMDAIRGSAGQPIDLCEREL